jgi:arylsulfatase A
MPTEEVTLAELMRGHGYATGHIGKWHLGYTPETMPNGQGFDYSFGHMGGCIDNYSHFFYWVGPNRHDLWRQGREVWHDGEYFGDLMVNECKGFISRNRKQPFFIYWAINWPHYPLQGTRKWRRHYADLPHPRDKYATFVSTTDELIGMVLDHLETLGLRDNTIVIFQSDHGHSVEERTFGGGGSAGPYRGHKGNLFEGGLRVPSIISWPAGLPQGEVRGQFVVGTDWWPTLAELTGARIPAGLHLDGRSIAGVIRDGKAGTPHDKYYWQLGKGNRAQWVVRQGDWKLYGNARENVKPPSAAALSEADKVAFLADLAADVSETRNVAGENPEVLKRLQAIAALYQAELN